MKNRNLCHTFSAMTHASPEALGVQDHDRMKIKKK